VIDPKFTEDISDEGYTALSDTLESTYGGITRLKNYILSSGEKPFPIFAPQNHAPSYTKEKTPLSDAVQIIQETAQKHSACGNHYPLITDLKEFTEWIGYDEKTTYIFLLRDTLLPYLYFKKYKGENAAAWMLGRKMMWELTGDKESDDAVIRNDINDALENGHCRDFEALREYCTPRILEKLKRYPQFEDVVRKLLSEIRTEKIIVVESGCYGTFPLLLCALDERVDVRMFTAIPMLFDTYGDKLFTRAYEKNRAFETLASQDMLMQYAGFDGGRFFVKMCIDGEIIEKSNHEISEMLSYSITEGGKTKHE